MRCPHSHFRRGKRILIIYRDGRHEVRRWHSRGDDSVRFEDGTVVRLRHIRNLSIYKQPDRTASATKDKA